MKCNLNYIGTIFCLVFILFASCKKEQKTPPQTTPTKLVLAPLSVSGNTIQLNWMISNDDSVIKYIIKKKLDSTKTSLLSKDNIYLDRDKTQFIDNIILVPYVQYYVEAQLSNGRTIASNVETYYSTYDFVGAYPEDAILDRNSRQLYTYDRTGGIAVYDLQTRKIVSTRVNGNIGYCDIGFHNGVKELYVPRTDGWLLIYDANTLEFIDQVQTGMQSRCVVSRNGLLFVSCDSNGWRISSYDRATKALVSQSPELLINEQRIKLMPSTNYEFIGLSYGDWVSSYKFDNTGKFLSQQTNSISGAGVATGVFEIFPDGSKFITHTNGNIIKTDLTSLSVLPHGSFSFTGFDFDNTNQLIYAACRTKHIQTYAMSDYHLTGTVDTKGYPLKIFYDNGTVLCLSMNVDPISSSSALPPGVFLEKL